MGRKSAPRAGKWLRKFAIRVVALAAAAFVLSSVLVIADGNVKSAEVCAPNTRAFIPLLRMGVSVFILADTEAVIADADRTPVFYARAGLPANESSLHVRQEDRLVHALDLGTFNRLEWLNWAAKLTFRAMSFHTLRHCGHGRPPARGVGVSGLDKSAPQLCGPPVAGFPGKHHILPHATSKNGRIATPHANRSPQRGCKRWPASKLPKLIAAAFVPSGSATCSRAGDEATFPNRPIEIVFWATPGGPPSTLLSWALAGAAPADPHVPDVITASSGTVNMPTGRIPFAPEDVTPILRNRIDPFLVAVPDDRPSCTLGDLFKAAHVPPDEVSMSGFSPSTHPHNRDRYK